MSSEHAIIVARNKETGAIELPLDDLTLYDTSDYCVASRWTGNGGTSSVMDSVRRRYGEEWTITLYVRSGPDWCGSKAAD